MDSASDSLANSHPMEKRREFHNLKFIFNMLKKALISVPYFPALFKRKFLALLSLDLSGLFQ